MLLIKRFLLVFLRQKERRKGSVRAAGTSCRYKIVDLLQSAPPGGDFGRPYLFSELFSHGQVLRILLDPNADRRKRRCDDRRQDDMQQMRFLVIAEQMRAEHRFRFRVKTREEIAAA